MKISYFHYLFLISLIPTYKWLLAEYWLGVNQGHGDRVVSLQQQQACAAKTGAECEKCGRVGLAGPAGLWLHVMIRVYRFFSFHAFSESVA